MLYFIIQDAFTACRMAFSESETAKMSLKDKSDLFFYDYSLHPLFVQENYIHAVPHARLVLVNLSGEVIGVQAAYSTIGTASLKFDVCLEKLAINSAFLTNMS